jgi:RimJ/RimL family protein N-acetyltransferase
VAAAIVSGRVVSTAFTSAFSDRFADVGIRTLEAYRNRGYATAAACAVIQQVQQSDRVPVWATYENNLPSLAVAQRLGFRYAARRTDVYFRKD